MNLTPFEDILRQAIGLDAASIGSSALRRAIEMSAKESGAGDADAFLERVRASPGELAALVDAVVVPETWFFRHHEAFLALMRIAQTARPAAAEPLRVLSVPCATGEEPYSIAMALLDAQIPPGTFKVDAVDVSALVIAKAEEGLYRSNSFRGRDLGYRDRYFHREGQAYRLDPRPRNAVSFAQGNLLAADFKFGALYDVVFCRNLLIYFDAATQERAVRALSRLVRPGGHVFVGPSEANLLLSHGFEPVNAAMTFGFRRAAAASVTAPSAPKVAIKAPRVGAARPRRFTVHGPAVETATIPAPRPPATGVVEMRRLADEGHLADAARLCEAELKRRPSAEVLLLLGVIRDATGSTAEAAELYRKTLYLDPGNQEALAHWSLLLERGGDLAGARALNERMSRLSRSRGGAA